MAKTRLPHFYQNIVKILTLFCRGDLDYLNVCGDEPPAGRLGEDKPLDDGEQAEGGEAEHHDQQQVQQPCKHLGQWSSEILQIFDILQTFLMLIVLRGL